MRRLCMVIWLGLATTGAGAQSPDDAKLFLGDAIRMVEQCPHLILDTNVASQLAGLAGIVMPEAQVQARNENQMAMLPSIRPQPEPVPAPDMAIPKPQAPGQSGGVCDDALEIYGPSGYRMDGLVREATPEEMDARPKMR